MDKVTQNRNNLKYTIILIIYALGINLLLPRLVGLMGWPIYLDSIGTVGAAALGGFVPGIIIGFMTNIMNTFFDSSSIYYSVISILIAVATTWLLYRNRGKLFTVKGIIQLILMLTFIGGVLGSLVTWFLFGAGDDDLSVGARTWIMETIGANEFLAHVIYTTAQDLLDKTITVLVVALILRLLPRDVYSYTWLSGWRQAPLGQEAMDLMKNMKFRSYSLRTKIAMILVLSSLAIAISLTFVAYKLFTDDTFDQNVKVAKTTASLAAAAIDPEKVDQYIKEGEDAPGYNDTEHLLYNIWDSSPDIEYIYVYQIQKDGCHVVFDLDTPDMEGGAPGDIVPFDESFSDVLPSLLAGDPIDPRVTNDTYGWLLTVYQPVYDSMGQCVCYAAADIAVRGIVAYERRFLAKMILIFLGFFFLVFSISLYLAKYQIVLPVNSMAFCASVFDTDDSDGRSVDAGLKRIKGLQINTGEEIENLYQALCRMCSDLINRMHEMRRQSETINEMQSGLILVMADMVESRDSNTGEHIHKTAAYTRIILEGLKRKGYYADQLTDKFMSDVEQSAPLHDVGKINVSDTILNKPGRFTDDEYEIMKTHTTAGKLILEQAISKVRGESYLSEAINMAGSHHEKWDGTGYPEGLKGEAIPLSARIMAIADVFDALASKRVYKDAMPFDKAVEIIRKDSGTHFDPKCVEAFMDSLDEVKRVHENIMGTALEDI